MGDWGVLHSADGSNGTGSAIADDVESPNGWNWAVLSFTAGVVGVLLWQGGFRLLTTNTRTDPFLGTKRSLFITALLSVTSTGAFFCALPKLPTDEPAFGAVFYHGPLWGVYYLFSRWVVGLYYVNKRYSQGLSVQDELSHVLSPCALFCVLAALITLDYAVMAADSATGFVVVQVCLSTSVFVVTAIALSRALRADEMAFTPSAIPVLRRLRLVLPLLAVASGVMLGLKAACYLGDDGCTALRLPFIHEDSHHTDKKNSSSQPKEMNAESFFYAAGVVIAPAAALAWAFAAPVPFLELTLCLPPGQNSGRAQCVITDPGCFFSFGVILFAAARFLLRCDGHDAPEYSNDETQVLRSPESGSDAVAPAAGADRPPPPDGTFLGALAQVARLGRAPRRGSELIGTTSRQVSPSRVWPSPRDRLPGFDGIKASPAVAMERPEPPSAGMSIPELGGYVFGGPAAPQPRCSTETGLTGLAQADLSQRETLGVSSVRFSQSESAVVPIAAVRRTVSDTTPAAQTRRAQTSAGSTPVATPREMPAKEQEKELTGAVCPEPQLEEQGRISEWMRRGLLGSPTVDGVDTDAALAETERRFTQRVPAPEPRRCRPDLPSVAAVQLRRSVASSRPVSLVSPMREVRISDDRGGSSADDTLVQIALAQSRSDLDLVSQAVAQEMDRHSPGSR
eukprot:TRINITY_DN9301_c0_g3_i1.p1 TRINITY_DN9301_c0_g3~~TRINITY_DN9301_c0_g3_i1.p1  ORF type:complete len:681 (+),score=96.30 TRINITY_DN9301_c0_g3_i1:88-2130(+)